VTVNRETVFIMTRFRKRQMSIIEGEDGPDHRSDVLAIPQSQSQISA
jgi:hypothetical protein